MKDQSTSSNPKREQQKRNAIKKLIKSKDDLVSSATDIYKSLTKIALYKKEEVTEQLLKKIKEAIDKVEKKNK